MCPACKLSFLYLLFNDSGNMMYKDWNFKILHLHRGERSSLLWQIPSQYLLMFSNNINYTEVFIRGISSPHRGSHKPWSIISSSGRHQPMAINSKYLSEIGEAKICKVIEQVHWLLPINLGHQNSTINYVQFCAVGILHVICTSD